MRYLTILVVLLGGATIADGQVQLHSAKEIQSMRDLLPAIEEGDDNINEVVADPTTMWYTLGTMPRAYWNSGSYHWAGYNISGDNQGPFFEQSKPHGMGGNANIDFPWRMGVAGGTHRTSNVDTYKFMWLPKDSAGKPKPVVWFPKNLSGPLGSSVGYAWVFPIGTTFGEVLYMKHGRYNYVFEVRTRTRESGEWAVEIYRPFPSKDSLIEALGREPQTRPVTALQTHLKTYEGRMYQQSDKQNRSRRAFTGTARVDVLPALPADTVAKLLMTTEFTSALGEEWVPTSKQDFHIVPGKYDGAFLGSDRGSCMQCHESTNVAARTFDSDRGWYGFVGGSDGILSWNPIAPGSQSKNGGNVPARMRRSFVRAGIVEQYSPSKHSKDNYRVITGLK